MPGAAIVTKLPYVEKLAIWSLVSVAETSDITLVGAVLSWLPLYLVHERGFSDTEMTRFASAAYFVNAACAIVGGWALDRYIVRGGSVNVGYKTVVNTCSQLKQKLDVRSLPELIRVAVQLLATASA